MYKFERYRQIDFSLDEKRMERIEKIPFDAYNKSDGLIPAFQRYFERMGHYALSVFTDGIYRNRTNLQFCKKHGIRLSGLALGRTQNNVKIDKKQSIRLIMLDLRSLLTPL